MRSVRRLQPSGIHTWEEGQSQVWRRGEPPLSRIQSCQEQHGEKMTERLVEGIWIDEKEKEEEE